MAEYIEREALIREIICDMASFIGNTNDVQKHDEQCNYAISCIEDAPTVDVMPVTHCEDCKHLRVHNTKELYAFCPKTNTTFLPFELDTRMHFCSLSERKDGGDSDALNRR